MRCELEERALRLLRPMLRESIDDAIDSVELRRLFCRPFFMSLSLQVLLLLSVSFESEHLLALVVLLRDSIRSENAAVCLFINFV